MEDKRTNAHRTTWRICPRCLLSFGGAVRPSARASVVSGRAPLRAAVPGRRRPRADPSELKPEQHRATIGRCAPKFGRARPQVMSAHQPSLGILLARAPTDYRRQRSFALSGPTVVKAHCGLTNIAAKGDFRAFRTPWARGFRPSVADLDKTWIGFGQVWPTLFRLGGLARNCLTSVHVLRKATSIGQYPSAHASERPGTHPWHFEHLPNNSATCSRRPVQRGQFGGYASAIRSGHHAMCPARVWFGILAIPRLDKVRSPREVPVRRSRRRWRALSCKPGRGQRTHETQALMPHSDVRIARALKQNCGPPPHL